MTRRLSDLTDHLYHQLDRLKDAGDPDQVALEAQRTEALVDIADRITDTAKLQLNAAKLFAEKGAAILPMLPPIGAADPTAAKLATPPKSGPRS